MAQRSNKPQASALKQFSEFARGHRGEVAEDGAPHFFGRMHLDFHGPVGDGVVVVQPRARQMQSCACVQGRCAVNEVAHHRMPHGRGMSPDLMGASCLDGPFHQHRTPVHGPAAAAKHLERRTAGLPVDGKPAPAGGREAIPAAPAVVRFHDGRPLCLKGGHGHGAPSHEHGSSGSVVQPMHRFGTIRKLCAACQECTEVLPPAPVDGRPGFFQHDCMVVVLVHDVEHVGQLEGRSCEFEYEIRDLGDKSVSFADKTNNHEATSSKCTGCVLVLNPHCCRNAGKCSI